MECSRCHNTSFQLWRPAGRNDNLLCENHLREKDVLNPSDVKIGMLNDKCVEYFPAVLIGHNYFYPHTKIPEDKYTEWKNGTNYLIYQVEITN